MDWEPQEHEFVNDDHTTIMVKVFEGGMVEVTYFDHDTTVVHHATDHWTDAGHIYSAGVTRICPGKHLPSTPAV